MKKSIYIMKRVHFLQETVDDGEVQIYSCKGELNLADPFTKAILSPTPFFKTKEYYMGKGYVKEISNNQEVD